MSEARGTAVGDSIAPARQRLDHRKRLRHASPALRSTSSFDTTPPAAPTGLVATPGDGTVDSDVDRERRTRPRRLQRLSQHDHARWHSDLAAQRRDARDVAGLRRQHGPNGTTYYYVVTAVDDSDQRVDRVERGHRDARRRRPSSRPASTSGPAAPTSRSAIRPSSTWRRSPSRPGSSGPGAGVANDDRHRRHRAVHPARHARRPPGRWLEPSTPTGSSASTTPRDVLAADFEDTATGAQPSDLRARRVITNDVWHHAAATYDGTTWRLYLDGRLEATEVENATPRSDTTQHAGLGVMLDHDRCARQHGRGSRACSTRHASGPAHAASPRSRRASTSSPPRRPGSSPDGRWATAPAPTVDDSVAPDADGTIIGYRHKLAGRRALRHPDRQCRAGPERHPALATRCSMASRSTTACRRRSRRPGRRSPGPTRPASPTRSRSRRASRSPAAGRATMSSGSRPFDGLNTIFDEIAVTVLDPGSGAELRPRLRRRRRPRDVRRQRRRLACRNSPSRPGSAATAPASRRETGAGGVAAIPLVTKGRNEADGTTVDMNYFLGIDAATGVLVADFEEGAAAATPGLNHPFGHDTVIQNGVWYHAAATYDGTTWRLYLNGVLDAHRSSSASRSAPTAPSTPASARRMNSSGTPVGAFNGILDEARIWNSARSEAQIQAAMTGPLASAPGHRRPLEHGRGRRARPSPAPPGPRSTARSTNGPLFVAGHAVRLDRQRRPECPDQRRAHRRRDRRVRQPRRCRSVSATRTADTLTTSFYGRTAGPVGGRGLHDRRHPGHAALRR